MDEVQLVVDQFPVGDNGRVRTLAASPHRLLWRDANRLVPVTIEWQRVNIVTFDAIPLES